MSKIGYILLITCLVGNYCCPALAQEKIVEFDINDVSRLALESNFDIQIFRIDRSISEKDLLKEESIYDTNIDASYEYDEDRLDKTNIIQGTRISTVSQDITVSKKLPTGTLLSLGYEHGRHSSDSVYNSINPYHESIGTISITQSLGKNALGIIDRNTIKITGLNIDNAVYTSLDKIEQELGDTQKAYWNLILAHKEVELTKNIFENSKYLYKINKKNFDLGMVEPPELYSVEANVNEREKDYVLAQDALNSAINLLRLKLALKEEVIIIPKDDFNGEKIDVSLAEVMKTALENRRDYKSAKNTVKAKGLSVELKKNSLWPEIDLTGTLKKNGLDRDFGKSVKEVTGKDYPEYTVGVTFKFPLENSDARAEYSQEKLEKAKALISLKKIECLIFVQVHDAYIHAKKMLESSCLMKRAAELEHMKYQGEEDRFNKGRSDTDQLLRYQRDYLRSNIVSLTELYRYQAAIIDLNIVMNNLLKEEV